MRWLPWLFSIALVAAVIVAALHFSEAREFARLAERAEPLWLLVAVLLQLGTYLAQGQVFRRVARAARYALRLSTACQVSLVKLFVDQAVPSAGLSGTVVLANVLQHKGVPGPIVAAGLVVDHASYYAATVVCLVVALVIAGAHGETNTILLLVSLVFVLFGIGLSVFLLSLSGRSIRKLPNVLGRVRPLRTVLDFIKEADPHLARSPGLLLEASVYQLVIILCDAGTMWVLVRALGASGSPAGVFASFMISSLLRIIGFLPGGLGTFEAASVVTLRMVGVPIAAALAATLLFRGLSFWLPMLPGLWFARHAMGRLPADREAPG